MRMRRNLVTGVAAAALALTACGIAVGSSGGTPGDHATSVSAGQAPADTWVTEEEDIAKLKRHIAWKAADPAGVRRPQADTSWFTEQGDLAEVKRDALRRAAQHARSK
jgi:hypothetical protein